MSASFGSAAIFLILTSTETGAEGASYFYWECKILPRSDRWSCGSGRSIRGKKTNRSQLTKMSAFADIGVHRSILIRISLNMCKLRLIYNSAIFILIWNGLPALATVYDSDGSSINVQYSHDFQATDGDTITLPAGTFDWTTGVSFSKGITLRGATTITGAGGPNAVANDVTIVKDDVPRSSQIVGVTVSGSRVFRLTGITFAASVTQVNGSTDGAFHFTSPDLTARFRVDNCHFASLHQAKLIRNS